MNLIQRLMAHGFAGCLCSVLGGAIGIALAIPSSAQFGAGSPNPSGDYLVDFPAWAITVIIKGIWILGGAIVGALCGFFGGVLVNAILVRRLGMTKPGKPPEPPAAE